MNPWLALIAALAFLALSLLVLHWCERSTGMDRRYE